MFITLSSKKGNIWQQFLDFEESDGKMSLRGLRSCFTLLKKGLKKISALSEKPYFSFFSVCYLGCDLHTEFHKLVTKLYLGLWTWVKPVVRTLVIKPPSSSINLDKPSSFMVHCIVIRKY